MCKYPENYIHNVTIHEKQWSKVGDQLSLKCKPGHKLEGSRLIKCQSDGTWFPTPGTCIPQHEETENSTAAEGMLQCTSYVIYYNTVTVTGDRVPVLMYHALHYYIMKHYIFPLMQDNVIIVAYT